MITTAHNSRQSFRSSHRSIAIAVDTEADSLHCYFEKLCLVQLSFAEKDYLVDPLAGFDLQPLCAALAEKEIVLQGADFDLRLLRRTHGFQRDAKFSTP